MAEREKDRKMKLADMINKTDESTEEQFKNFMRLFIPKMPNDIKAFFEHVGEDKVFDMVRGAIVLTIFQHDLGQEIKDRVIDAMVKSMESGFIKLASEDLIDMTVDKDGQILFSRKKE